MAQQIINIGTAANDGTGDTLREASRKSRDNDTELYSIKEDVTNKKIDVETNKTSDTFYPSIKSIVDWVTNFFVKGSGTANYLPKFGVGGKVVGDSQVFDNGTNIGIENTLPLAKVHIGNGTLNNSVDSQILISRLVDNTKAGNGHAFSDSSDVSRGGVIGYTSYDARIKYSGANNSDHYAAFQASLTYSSTGAIGNVYGLFTKGTITSGVITNNYGLYADSPLYSAGTIINNWGIYVTPQVAATNNYAAAFMGKVGIGNSTPAVLLDVLGANPRMYLTDNATGYSMIKMNSTVAGSTFYIGHESNAGGAILTGSTPNSSVLLTGGSYHLHFGTNGTMRMTLNGANGNLGIGIIVALEKLHVVGNGKFTGSVQVGDNTDVASATNAGAIRYRSDANNSYADMCMLTGVATYSWVNIVTNTF